MNRFMKTAIALLLAMSVTAPVLAAPSYGSNTDFSDIYTEEFAWARGYIQTMAAKGLISGYEDGTFRPDNDVTRLEALSLFARAMGSNDNANANILSIAHEQYDYTIRAYGLSWGTDEIAYLMYKGVLKKSDLDTYLKDAEKDTPMSRYEAAIIITKAMHGEDEALSDFGVVLDYVDSREVPSNAIQYVAYATDAGIMEGMGDGTFSPNTSVKRSQMAVMLSRTVEVTNYSFEKVKLNSVDTATRTITVTSSDGNQKQYIYTDDTIMRSMGDEVKPRNLDTSVDAVITLSGASLAEVETTSSQPDQTITGKFVNHSLSSGVTSIKVSLTSGGTQSYECSQNLSVTYDNSPATLKSFASGDSVTLNIVNGKVVSVVGEDKTTTINGAVVDNLDLTNGVKLQITHGDKAYDGNIYEVSSDVSVKKNDVSVGLDSIYKGDKVNLTLEYGVVTKIVATSNKKVVEGNIRSITIASPQSTMLVAVKNQEVEYIIPKDVEIIVNDEEGSLYDFRVGDSVKLTLESEAITKIVASTTQESSGNITGVVTGINTSYGVISVTPEGSEEARQIFCKDDTTTIVAADGKTKRMKDIEVGQTVDVRGTVSNGVFVGKLLVIVAQ